MRQYYKKGKTVEKKKSAFGMLSVKAGIDKNPNPTQADRIAGAKMSGPRQKKAMGGPAGAKMSGPRQKKAINFSYSSPYDVGAFKDKVMKQYKERINTAKAKKQDKARVKKMGGGMMRKQFGKGGDAYHTTKDGRRVKKGLYYYMNRAKKAGKSRPGKGTVTDKALKRSAKTAKK